MTPISLEKDVIYEPVMQLTADGKITFVVKDQFGRVVGDATDAVVKSMKKTLGKK